MKTATSPSTPDLSIEQVQARLRQRILPISENETIGLHKALGRVLAQDVISPISVPPHDNSAMDGYAFDGACLAQGKLITLTLIGTVLAGRGWTQPLNAGECVKIMTGAIMPNGLDTVVPLELTERDGDTVRFDASRFSRGANRRQKGEDLMAGQSALNAGQRVTPAALGLLASLGLVSEPVTFAPARPPRQAHLPWDAAS